MRFAPLLAASVVAIGLSAAGTPSQAAQLLPKLETSHSTLAQSVYWRRGGGYCYRWRHICADRWGWGGFGFRRCLWRHGC